MDQGKWAGGTSQPPGWVSSRAPRTAAGARGSLEWMRCEAGGERQMNGNTRHDAANLGDGTSGNWDQRWRVHGDDAWITSCPKLRN